MTDRDVNFKKTFNCLAPSSNSTLNKQHHLTPTLTPLWTPPSTSPHRCHPKTYWSPTTPWSSISPPFPSQFPHNLLISLTHVTLNFISVLLSPSSLIPHLYLFLTEVSLCLFFFLSFSSLSRIGQLLLIVLGY